MLSAIGRRTTARNMMKTVNCSFSTEAASVGQKKNKAVVSSKLEFGDAKKNSLGEAEDIFRANTLAGLGQKYHNMNRAFNELRSGVALTPEMEKDLALVHDVMSLKTGDATEIKKAKTRALVEHYQRRPGDTGSIEVQVVLLTERINNAKFHLVRNVTDKKLVRPLTAMITRRRKFLQYLRKKRFRTYQVICRDLNVDEDEFYTVGKTANRQPYYEPDRPKTTRPITDRFKRNRWTKPGTKPREQEDTRISLIADTYEF